LFRFLSASQNYGTNENHLHERCRWQEGKVEVANAALRTMTKWNGRLLASRAKSKAAFFIDMKTDLAELSQAI
jgi:hypothetical protein